MRRIVRPEILDTRDASPEEIRDSLIDLQRINRWFGGISTTAKLIETVLERTGAHELSVLDVASASGDIVEAIRQQLAPRGVRLRSTLLDRDPSHLRFGQAVAVRGDALALPFRDGSFDIVTCSLFIHHLEPEQVEIFAREALRVARLGLLINDLRRSYLHLAAVWAGKPLFRRITRHDSVASIWNAYTPDEVLSMMNHGTARQVEIRKTYLFRMGAIAWK